MVPTISIDDFCETGAGGTPSRSKLERYYERGTIPWVKSGELRESIIIDTEEHITECALRESNAKIVPAGSLLLAMYGATVGRVGILGVPATTNQAVCHIIPDPEMADRQYLFWALRASLPELLSQRVGGAQPNISQSIIRRLGIRLPPLPEQRRIADILDRAEALRAKRRAALAQVNDLERAIFLETFGDPAANPRQWECAPLGEVIERIDSGKSPVCLDRPRSGDEWGILKLGAATWGEYRASENKALPPGFTPDTRHQVHAGDILFVRKNTYELVGATSFVDVTPPKLLLPDLIFRLVIKDVAPLVPLFLQRMLAFPTMRKITQKLASGSSDSMPNISKSRLLQLSIIAPPVPLQQEFARRVQAIDRLKSKYRQSLAEMDALFQSLQHRAFRGEL